MEILQGEGTTSGGSNDAPVAAPEKHVEEHFSCRSSSSSRVWYLYQYSYSMHIYPEIQPQL